MYKRWRHQIIKELLDKLDPTLLLETKCFFGGGTAAVLLLGEYRESADVDFLCSSREGYRELRNIVGQTSLGRVLSEDVHHVRDIRADQYGIRTVLQIGDTPIKFEIVLEARIDLDGAIHPDLGVPVLSQEDMFAEKLLANADRGRDRGHFSRDIIDLAMMARAWGGIPEPAWQKARNAYGQSVDKSFEAATAMIGDRAYLLRCVDHMAMDRGLADTILETLSGLDVPDVSTGFGPR